MNECKYWRMANEASKNNTTNFLWNAHFHIYEVFAEEATKHWKLENCAGIQISNPYYVGGCYLVWYADSHSVSLSQAHTPKSNSGERKRRRFSEHQWGSTSKWRLGGVILWKSAVHNRFMNPSVFFLLHTLMRLPLILIGERFPAVLLLSE